MESHQTQFYVPKIFQQDEDTRSSQITVQEMRIEQMNKKLQLADHAILEDKSKCYLQSLVENLQKRWHEIEDAHFKILIETSTSEHAYFRNKMFEELEERFEETNKKLVIKMTKSNQTGRHKIKLPTLKLPIFTGAYESWSSFYDLFTKIIHEDPSLSSTEKMQYLKTHVQGDAGKLIKHLPVCEANYVTAWTIITKRYKNQRVITSKHINNLLNLEKIYEPTATNLKNLHDTIRVNLEALKSQGIDISTWDPILAGILSKTWDSETNEKYELQLEDPTQPQRVSEMLSFLERRFKCLENITDSRHTETTAKQQNQPVSLNLPIYRPTEARYTTCWLCHSKWHNIYKCPQFRELSPQDRKEVATRNEMCQNCLMHTTDEACRSKKSCAFCGEAGHHSTLHQEQRHSMIHEATQKVLSLVTRAVVSKPVRKLQEIPTTTTYKSSMLQDNHQTLRKPVVTTQDRSKEEKKTNPIKEEIRKTPHIPNKKYKRLPEERLKWLKTTLELLQLLI